jgi:hypothetical protein
MRICPVVAALFHVDKWMDRRTHMMKLVIAFHNFTTLPKNGKSRKIIVAKNGFHQESQGRLITAEWGMHENRNTKRGILIEHCGYVSENHNVECKYSGVQPLKIP